MYLSSPFMPLTILTLRNGVQIVGDKTILRQRSAIVALPAKQILLYNTNVLFAQYDWTVGRIGKHVAKSHCPATKPSTLNKLPVR